MCITAGLDLRGKASTWLRPQRGRTSSSRRIGSPLLCVPFGDEGIYLSPLFRRSRPGLFLRSCYESVSYVAERCIVRPLRGLTAEVFVPSAILFPNLKHCSRNIKAWFLRIKSIALNAQNGCFAT